MPQSNIPHRKIGEDEDELLNRIWTELDTAEPSEHHGFEDVQTRIRRKQNRRRFYQLSLAAGIGAAIVVGILQFGTPQTLPTPDAFEQLQQMGVAVDRGQVILTTDDGTSIALGQTARIEQQAEGGVALHTETGTQVALQKERMLKVEVPAGRQFDMTLSDGTRVWLNAGSTLEYPAGFTNRSERRVHLTGEAFFEVERDTCRPFYVDLSHRECIRVLGTSFNVSAYADATEHITTLQTGKISYSFGEKDVTLKPNQQLLADHTTGTTRVGAVDASAYGAWKEGWLWFEAEKLSTLALRLGRTYGIRLEIADRLRDYTFSGKIRQDRGIDYILNLFTETSDITCEVTEGVMRLL